MGSRADHVNYAGPDRPGGRGWARPMRGLAGPAEVLSDRQRRLYEQAQDVRGELEVHRLSGERLVDDLAVLVLGLLETGLTQARVTKLLRLGPAKVSDYKVRGETVRALRETRS